METTVRQVLFQFFGETYRGAVKRFFGMMLRSIIDLIYRGSREDSLDRAAISDLFGVYEDSSHLGYERIGKTASSGVYWM